jgi:hypothetical protein
MMLSATSGSTNEACLESRSLMMSAAFGDSCLEMDCPPPAIYAPGSFCPVCLMMVACRCLVLPAALLIACRSCGAGAGGRSTRPGFSIGPFRPCREPFVTAASRSFLAACGSLRIGRSLLLARHVYIGSGAAGGPGIRTQLIGSGQDRLLLESNRV